MNVIIMEHAKSMLAESLIMKASSTSNNQHVKPTFISQSITQILIKQ